MSLYNNVYLILLLSFLMACNNVSRNDIEAAYNANVELQKLNSDYDEIIFRSSAHFEKALMMDRTRAKPFCDKARAAKIYSDTICDYIEDIKREIERKAYGINTYSDDTLHNHIHTGKESGAHDILMGHEMVADSIQLRLTKYRRMLLNLLTSSSFFQYNIKRDTTDLKIGLLTIEKNGESWPEYTFASKSVLATLVALSGIEADIKRSELKMLGYLYTHMDDDYYGLPQISFGYLQGTIEAPKEAIIGIDSISFSFWKSHITTFDMTIVSNGKSVTMTSGSAKLTEEMKNDLLELKPQDIVVINNVRMEEYGERRSLGGVTITIKDTTENVSPYFYLRF